MHNINLILVGLVLISSNSCNSDELADLNIDPTVSNELDWRFLLTHGQHQLYDESALDQVIYIAPLMQHIATLSNAMHGAGDKYFRNGATFNYPYREAYVGALKTFAEIIRKTDPSKSDFELVNLHYLAQVCYILKMHIVTDLYGNVPYAEANLGIEGIFFAKFDTQEFIYKDMLGKLEIAATLIGSGTDDIGDADLLYGGHLDRWRRLTNSIMLRLAMRISNIDPVTAEYYVKKAIDGGVMQGNIDIAYIPTEKGSYNNPIGTIFDPQKLLSESMLSKTMIDYLQSHNDPRLLIYTSGIGALSEPKNKSYEAQKGLPNGFDPETIKSFLGVETSIDRQLIFSGINEDLTNLDDPYLLMTYAEVELLLAEASLKGWHEGIATTHYNKAVQAAMQQWSIFGGFNISDSEIQEYLAANPFDDSFQMIGEQLWVSSFLNWYETFSNWRRTGFPDLDPINYQGNISNGQIFRRFEYSSTEAAVNPNQEIGGTAPDHVLTRVWWDVN